MVTCFVNAITLQFWEALKPEPFILKRQLLGKKNLFLSFLSKKRKKIYIFSQQERWIVLDFQLTPVTTDAKLWICPT